MVGGLITGVISLRPGHALSICSSVAGGSMITLLEFKMMSSLIMGLPLPPVTCYLILAVLAAPALIKSGVNPMAAHLFVFFLRCFGQHQPVP